MMSLLKIGHFKKRGLFNKGVSDANGKGGMAQEVRETFFIKVNRSGRRIKCL